MIDPTGLELAPQTTNPGADERSTLWVDSADNKFTVRDARIEGGLDVSGFSAFSGHADALSVSGMSAVSGRFEDLYVSGNLDVDGSITFSGISAFSGQFDWLDVASGLSASSGYFDYATADVANISEVSGWSGEFDWLDSTSGLSAFSGQFQFLSASDFSAAGDATVNGDLAVENDLAVSGQAYFSEASGWSGEFDWLDVSSGLSAFSGHFDYITADEGLVADVTNISAVSGWSGQFDWLDVTSGFSAFSGHFDYITADEGLVADVTNISEVSGWSGEFDWLDVTSGFSGFSGKIDYLKASEFSSTGDAYVGGKLTVDGLIDPTGLELTPQVANPGGVEANTLWVDSSDSKFRMKSIRVEDIDASGFSAFSGMVDLLDSSHFSAFSSRSPFMEVGYVAGLLYLWDLEESSEPFVDSRAGVKLYDDNLPPTRQVKFGQPSILGNGAKFNEGSSSGTSALPSIGASVSFWMKSEASSDSKAYVYDIGDASAGNTFFRFAVVSNLVEVYTAGSLTYRSVDSAVNPIQSGEVVHVVVVYDETLHVRVYVNGVKLSPSIDNEYTTISGTNISIGGTTGTNKYIGYLDQFAIYNTALDDYQVSLIYNNGNATNLNPRLQVSDHEVSVIEFSAFSGQFDYTTADIANISEVSGWSGEFDWLDVTSGFSGFSGHFDWLDVASGLSAFSGHFDYITADEGLAAGAHCAAYVSTSVAVTVTSAGTYYNLFKNCALAASTDFAPANFTVDDANKRFTYDGEMTAAFKVRASISFSSGDNGTVSLRLAKNGTGMSQSTISLEDVIKIGNVGIEWQVELDEDDYVEVLVTHTQNGANVTPDKATVCIEPV